ncbi:hypothetical protein CDV36_007195 [Fusarium kuroshium]|uniref:Zn(2)-C6 fungal-type domain-containing protein n=2 Tax=Fusarium solani species complex TaxID=232080 RepID=A0A3M2S6F7_9HYPO|nr:hypothetical protein CDV36_007195 [Fusarium kuroshium]RSL84803.1 hypothetical protein CEP51_003670 [Fusarium floridanum]
MASDLRQKKLKCDGEYPECGRCSGMGEPCKYSARLPMGRPKKRKLQHENEAQDSSTATFSSGVSTATLEKSVSSETTSDLEPIAFDPCLQPPNDLTAEVVSWGCETNVDPKLLAVETDPGQQTCACLANLYLSLEEVRKADNLAFAARLSLLRDLTANASSIIQCQVCPTKFLWAMQNAQLLNTLIISIAEGYKKIVKSVEDETQRAQEGNESKLLFISDGEKYEQTSQNGNPSYGQSGFPLSLDPLDWQNIAKKAIKAELFGTKHSISPSFTTMLQHMEDRQQGWHSGSLPVTSGIGHRLPHQMKDKEPHCVSLVKHTRGMVSQLLADI